MPVTMPVEPTVAVPGLPLLHVPPVGVTVKVVVAPTHTVYIPLIDGVGFTVTITFFTHPAGEVYTTVAVPTETLFTVTVVAAVNGVSVATVTGAILHVPKPGDDDKVVALPMQIDKFPYIDGVGFTVITFVAKQFPGKV